MSDILWEHEDPVIDLGVKVPLWIERDITANSIAGILQAVGLYGLEKACSTGVYMPAVTYHLARETMGQYDEFVMDYLEAEMGYCPTSEPRETPDQFCVRLLSLAVAIWAIKIQHDVRAALKARENE
jgi:hypothetical protein